MKHVLISISDQILETIEPGCEAIRFIIPYVSGACFAFGLHDYFCNNINLNYVWNTFLFVFFTFVSLALHEIGHFIFAASYECSNIKIGVITINCIPVALYTQYNTRKVMKAKEEFAISMAGIYCNLLFAGMLLHLSRRVMTYELTFYVVALFNVNLVLENCFIRKESDVESALSGLFKVKSFVETMHQYYGTKQKRIALLKSKNGRVLFMLFSLVYVERIVIIIIFILINVAFMIHAL